MEIENNKTKTNVKNIILIIIIIIITILGIFSMIKKIKKEDLPPTEITLVEFDMQPINLNEQKTEIITENIVKNKENSTAENNKNNESNSPSNIDNSISIRTNSNFLPRFAYDAGKKVNFYMSLNTIESIKPNIIKTNINSVSNRNFSKTESTQDICNTKLCIELSSSNNLYSSSNAQDLRLQFTYIVRSSEIDITRFNSAEFYVFANGQYHGPYEIDTFEVTNFLNRGIINNQTVDEYYQGSEEIEYSITTENLLNKLNGQTNISKILIIPYRRYDEYKGYFKMTNAKLVAYKNKNYQPQKKYTIKVSSDQLREKIVSNMITNATIEWSPSSGFTYTDPSGKNFIFPPQYFYHGIPYIDAIDTTRNSFLKQVWSKNYHESLENGTVNTKKLRGMYCSSSVYEAVTESLPSKTNYAWTKAYLTSPDIKFIDMKYNYGSTGDSYNTNNVKNYYLSKNDNDEEKVKEHFYNAYKKLSPGDGVVHYIDYISSCKETNKALLKILKLSGNKKIVNENGIEYYPYDGPQINKGHVMLVTGYPKVVYSSSGKIDPEASCVVVTEITNSYQDTTKPYSIKNNTTFEDAISKELKSNYGFKKNPNITNLNSLEEIEGKHTQWNIHRKISFADLYRGLQCSPYLPFTFTEYNETKDKIAEIEKPKVKLINGNTLDDISKGIKGTIVTNYTIQSITYTVTSFGTNNNINKEVKYQATEYPDSTKVYSLYYQADKNITSEFIKTINQLQLQKDIIYDATITVDLGTKVSSNTLKTDTVAALYLKSDYYFDDMNFYGCIVDSYNKLKNTSYNYSVRLSSKDLSQIKTLECSDREIKSLKGLEKLTNLESADFSKNNITNIDLSKNKELKTLKIYYTDIKKINISENKNLKELYLYEGIKEDTSKKIITIK